LLDDTASRVDILLPVLNYLVSKGYVERVTEDPKKGDDTFHLADAGKKVPT
jgi:hypothetical protein